MCKKFISLNLTNSWHCHCVFPFVNQVGAKHIMTFDSRVAEMHRGLCCLMDVPQLRTFGKLSPCSSESFIAFHHVALFLLVSIYVG